ncbi:hypothetical protein BT93_C0059 [Corymbia citriodora subsp. variegata]|nr:hypothetical protein BT93_C0059 [Corymbia citriodora subsp. variegata]
MSMATTMLVIKPLFSPLIHHQSSRTARLHHHTIPTPLRRVPTHLPTSLASAAAAAAPPSAAESLVDDFDPELPIEEALTPPSSWYTDPSFLDLELDRIFYRGWQAVGCTDQVKSPQAFFTGRLGSVEFVVCRDDNGKIHAFHNVCRHHASLLASGSGKKSCFVCPYHGWTYALNGALLRATRIKGIRNFDVKEFGLIPLKVATWGPFVLLNFEKDVSPNQEVESDIAAKEWTGSCVDILGNSCIDPSLTYLCRREYTLECNWKVFCDNYLDGGYHVPYAHKGLASGLKLDSYSTTTHEKVSLQICEGGSTDNADDFDRLGVKALYAFIYPNFMINRMTRFSWREVCRIVKEYRLKILFCVKAFRKALNLQPIAVEGMRQQLKMPCTISMVCSIAISKGELQVS